MEGFNYEHCVLQFFKCNATIIKNSNETIEFFGNVSIFNNYILLEDIENKKLDIVKIIMLDTISSIDILENE
jgi:hypothetical protein